MFFRVRIKERCQIISDFVSEHLRKYLKLYEIILIPIIFSLLPILVRQKEAYCAYVLLVMVGYWVTECIPLPAASLLPVILFPAFGILSSKCTTQIYFQVLTHFQNVFI